MGNLEGRPGSGNNDQGNSTGDSGSSEGREQVGLIAINVRWKSLNSKLVDLAGYTVGKLSSASWDRILLRGYRRSNLNPLFNLGQPVETREGFPSSIQLHLQEQPIPQDSSTTADITISLGALCTQVATHLDTWQKQERERLHPSYTDALTQTGNNLRLLAEVADDLSVTMHMRRDDEAFSVTGLSLGNYDTPNF